MFISVRFCGLSSLLLLYQLVLRPLFSLPPLYSLPLLGTQPSLFEFVANLNSPSVVNASSHVSLVPASRLRVPESAHDSRDEEYMSALNMMRAQKEKDTCLAADRLAEIESALADLDVVNPTIQSRNASVLADREETKRIWNELTFVTVDAVVITSL